MLFSIQTDTGVCAMFYLNLIKSTSGSEFWIMRKLREFHLNSRTSNLNNRVVILRELKKYRRLARFRNDEIREEEARWN